MMKRLFALLALAATVLCLFAGCGSKNTMIDEDKAQKIVLEDAGVSKYDVSDLHAHVGIQDNTAVYSIHFTLEGTEYEYVVDAMTGQIISAEKPE